MDIKKADNRKYFCKYNKYDNNAVLLSKFILELDFDSSIFAVNLENEFDFRKKNLKIMKKSDGLKYKSSKSLKSNNKTNYNGVSEIRKNGRLIAYTAAWVDLEGKTQRKSFSISGYGRQLALRLAVRTRRENEKLNQYPVYKKN